MSSVVIDECRIDRACASLLWSLQSHLQRQSTRSLSTEVSADVCSWMMGQSTPYSRRGRISDSSSSSPFERRNASKKWLGADHMCYIAHPHSVKQPKYTIELVSSILIAPHSQEPPTQSPDFLVISIEVDDVVSLAIERISLRSSRPRRQWRWMWMIII